MPSTCTRPQAQFWERTRLAKAAGVRLSESGSSPVLSATGPGRAAFGRVARTGVAVFAMASALWLLYSSGLAVRHLPLPNVVYAQNSGPGLGNLAYTETEVWTPIAILKSGPVYRPSTPQQKQKVGHGVAFMAGGYLNTIFSRNKGGDLDVGGIDVWNVADPRSPTKVRTHNTANTHKFREAHSVGLWNRNGQIVLAAQSHEGVVFFDVSNPNAANLPFLSELDLPDIERGNYDGAWWLALQAPYVYVAGVGQGLYVVDASNPSSPTLVNRLTALELGMRPASVFAVGNLLVVAEARLPKKFLAMDIADPENPTKIGTPSTARAGYSRMFTAGKLFTSGGNGARPKMYIHHVSHDGSVTVGGSAGSGLHQGGYGSYQDGFFFSGFTTKVAKFRIDPPRMIGTGSSRLPGRDEDFAQPLGNLIFAGNDHTQGSALIPHQTARDTVSPKVDWVHPPDGATGQALTTRVGVSMSDEIMIESLTAGSFKITEPGGRQVAGQLSASKNNLNFSPDAPLEGATTYTVSVCGLTDLVGNELSGGDCFTSSFTTQPARPAVTIDPPTCSIGPFDPVAIGTQQTYAAGSTTGAPTSYAWTFGETAQDSQDASETTFSHATPGRILVKLEVSNAGRTARCIAVQVVHRALPASPPASTSSIVSEGQSAYVANPDNDTVTKIGAQHTKVWETPVGDNPRTLAIAPGDELWVANQNSGSITVLDRSTGRVKTTIDLGYGAAPYGVVFAPDNSRAYVSLESEGRLLELDAHGTTVRALDLGAPIRGVGVTSDSSRILVTRFVSEFADSGSVGEVYEVDAATLSLTRTIELAFDAGPDSTSTGRGVPNYLSQIRIAPDGLSAWVPSKKDNIARGRHREGTELDFETTSRAIASQIDLTSNVENLARRVDFDDRSLAQSVDFTPFGDVAAVAFLGSDVVEFWDANERTLLSSASVGRAPDGLAFRPDGRRLFVHNFLDRSVTVLDTSVFLDSTATKATVAATVSTVGSERLSAKVLSGKRIFYNAADSRMGRDGYVSCASCHLEGGSDQMVWDLTQFGEGLRNTIDLTGRRGTNGGVVHWSGDFDEIQDFENTVRHWFGGEGFMSDAEFETGTVSDPLGDAKAGVSADLDALAAYVSSLGRFPDSPHRQNDGSLTREGARGKIVFSEKGCARCHSGLDFTDDARHDVGTHRTSSGEGSRGDLSTLGFNTPTLKGLWLGAPFLHDGRHDSLSGVLDDDAHMGSSLTPGEKSDLEAFLLQIDTNEGATEATDREALVAFYNAAGGPSWTASWNWTTSEPLSKWHGVVTNSNGLVKTLDLGDNGLTGRIPDSVADLKSLTTLDLSGNPLWGRLPAGLPRLTELATVRLGGTSVCAPDEAAFRAWLTRLGLAIPACEATVPALTAIAVTSSAGADGTYAIGDKIQLTATFSETVAVTLTPALDLQVGGVTRVAEYESGTRTSSLVFGYTVQETDSDTDGVSVGSGALKGGISDLADNPAPAVSSPYGPFSQHKIDGVRPSLQARSVDGDKLTLTYSEALDEDSVPPASKFAVMVSGAPATVSTVDISGSTVELTLQEAVTSGESVGVGYAAPVSGQVKDIAGNAASGFGLAPAVNSTASGTAVTSTARFPANGTFSVTLRFDDRVTGLVADEILVSNGSLSSFSGAGETYTLDVTPTDDFEGHVQVTVPAGVAVDTGGIGNRAGEGRFPVDTREPTVTISGPAGPVYAAFDIQIAFTEDVTGFGADDITVANATVDRVTGTGADYTARLTPGSTGAVTADVVQGAAQDAAGNNSEAASTYSVESRQPEITTLGPFTVLEGVTAVATLAARFGGTSRESAVWSILAGTSGGPDRAKFSLTASGELSFVVAQDFEAPDDTGKDGTYEVSVQVTRGETSVIADLRVTLEDRDEPPAAPAAPTLTAVAGSATTLSVAWIPPPNEGKPAITGYDVQYREGASGDWSSGPQGVAGTTATIAGLQPDTAYQARVLASNDEGASDWSAAGSGSTDETVWVSIVAVASTAAEGELAEFRVSRSGPTTEPLDVRVLFASTTSETVRTLTVQIGAGETSVTRRVQVGDNTIVEDDVTVTWTLAEGEDYAVSAEHPSASVVLEENDVPEFAVSVQPGEITEGESATVTVAITNGVTFRQPQTITLSVSGTASASDYADLPATLTLRAFGSSPSFSATATLTAAVDQQDEEAETVTVTASHNGSAIGSATVTINSVSQDAALSALSLSGVDIGTFSAETTAYAASVANSVETTTVTATASHAEASVAIAPGSEVRLVEGDNTVTVTVTAADGTTRTYTVTVTRAGPPVVSVAAVASRVSEGERAEFRISLSEAAAESLRVGIRWERSDQSQSVTQHTVFRAGVSSKISSFSKSDDKVVREDLTVTITLEDGEGYRVSEDTRSAQVVLEENDAAEFALAVDPASVAEGETAKVQVRTTNGVTFAADQTIALGFAGSTATKGADYTVSAESLTLRAGRRRVTAAVTAIADSDQEDDETVRIEAAHGGAVIGTATLTITGSEPAPEAAGEEFSLAPQNASPSGIWSDGEVAWVADLADARLYAYRREDGERQAERDIATEPSPMGMWSDGQTLWVAHLGGGLRAHRLSDGARLLGRDLALEANAVPGGVWSDGETVWVSEWLGDTVQAYRLSSGRREAGRDIRLAGGNLMPAGLWSDGETLWVADWRERVYAYRLSDGSRDFRRDVEASAGDTDPTGLWSGGGALLATGWESGEVRAYRLAEAAAEAPRKKPGSGPTARAVSLPAIADPALRAAIGAALKKAPGETVSPQDLAGLEELTARNAGIRDLSGLEPAVSLKALDLGFNPLADLRPLAALPALESLNLDGAATDLQALASLPRLQRLSLRHNGIEDLWPLAGLTSLTELSLGGNRIADLWPLAGLGSLAVLRLDRNRIADLWPLASLAGLEALELEANRVQDLWPLAGLARLRSLALGGNGLSELHALSGLKGLRDLGLAGNAVEDLGALSALTGLRRLDLRGTAVGDLRPLRGLPSLVWVHLGGSGIADLTPLDGLDGLTAAGRDDLESPTRGRSRFRRPWGLELGPGGQ